MQDPFRLKKLYDNKEYDAVIEIWRDEQAHDSFNNWDYRHCMRSFYNRQLYDDCLEVYREFHEKNPDSDLLDLWMGWAVYYTRIKTYDPKKDNPEQLRKQVDYVLKHCSEKNELLRWKLIESMVKQIDREGSGFNRDPLLALHYLDMVDPTQLSSETWIPENKGENRYPQASPMEFWYSKRSKMLLKAEQYDACISCCDTALTSIKGPFNNNNDTWLRYRKAMSLLGIGQVDTAKEIALPLVCQNYQHWRLWQLMFDLSLLTGDDDAAIHYGAKCAMSPDSEPQMQVGFYDNLSNLWKKLGLVEETALLRYWVILVREEREWGPKAHQRSWQIPNEIKQMDKSEVFHRLRKIWKHMIDPERELTSGKIANVKGIIRTDDGISCLFTLADFVERPETVTKDMKVLLKKEKVSDPSKTRGIPYCARQIIIVE